MLMRDFSSKIVHALNEAYEVPSVENEPEVGINAPKQVHQCENCADFYIVDEPTNESVCPECGGEGHPFGDIVECDADPAKISSPRLDEEDEVEDELTIEEEEELKSEADALVTEGLKLLDRNDYKRFNEAYRPRSRVNSKGELEMMVESHGHVITSSRRMTSRQKSAYALSEKYVPAVPTVNSKKNEAIKAHRQLLMMKNESRAVKIQACRLLERMGVKYDYKKFNEGMNKFLAGRNLAEAIARINEDDEIGKSELEKMTPDEIASDVTDVIEDTGLEIITNDVDIEGDTATVNVRIQDSDEVEVLASEVQDVLQDVFDAPVEIAGPYESEGDKSVKDMAIIINPDADVTESDEIDSEEDKLEESDDPLNPSDDVIDDEQKMTESVRRRRSRRSRKNEAFVTGTGNIPLFALVTLNTSGDKANQPMFLAQDDSLIGGNEPNAEDLARLFVSFEAAQQYLQSAGIENEYEPVSISVVQNEDIDASIDQSAPEFGSEKDAIKENNDVMDPDADQILEDDEFEVDDKKYFSEDEKYYESVNGEEREIDKSEYDDAKATASEIEKIEESFNRRRNRRARRSRR